MNTNIESIKACLQDDCNAILDSTLTRFEHDEYQHSVKCDFDVDAVLNKRIERERVPYSTRQKSDVTAVATCSVIPKPLFKRGFVGNLIFN